MRKPNVKSENPLEAKFGKFIYLSKFILKYFIEV